MQFTLEMTLRQSYGSYTLGQTLDLGTALAYGDGTTVRPQLQVSAISTVEDYAIFRGSFLKVRGCSLLGAVAPPHLHRG